MITAISWKNIWRNKLRSIVVIVSVAIGVIGGALFSSIMQGWIEQRMRDAINIETSHIQIHANNYRDSEKVELGFTNTSNIFKTLDTLTDVVTYSKRINVLAMATGGYQPTGFILVGIDPEKEKELTELKKNLLDSCGNYFEQISGKPILISEKTAKELRIERYKITEGNLKEFKELGWKKSIIDSLETIKNQTFKNKATFIKKLNNIIPEKFVTENKLAFLRNTTVFKIGKKLEITVRSLSGNEIVSVFRVVGIFKTSNSMFDTKFAYVLNSDLETLIDAPEGFAHQIAIMTKNYETVDAVLKQLQNSFPEMDIQSWRTIMPDMAMYKDMMKFYGAIFMTIILFALGFAIVNTMLMVVLERVKELGMLMAIGMNRRKVFRMIMFETILLCLVGGIVGMLISAALIKYFGTSGIDLTMFAEGMEAFGFAAVIYPVLDLSFYIQITILVVLTGIFASIYPARKATKLNPAEAVRE